MVLLLSALEDCVPSPGTVEEIAEAAELGRIISRWLYTLPPEDRLLFVRRYWNGQALNDLADETGLTPAKLAQKMHRLRLGLKIVLEKEGIGL